MEIRGIVDMRFVLKLGIVLLVALGLVQLALWYSASRWFASLANELAPVAVLEYRSSFAWPNGRAGIRDVQLRPRFASSETATADALEVHVGGPVAMLGLLWSAPGTWPDRLDVEVQRLRLAAGLERHLSGLSSRLGYLAPFEALGCKGRGRFGGSDYAGLGWLQAHTDLELRLRSDRRQDTMHLLLAHDQQPLARIEVEIELGGVGSGHGSPVSVSAVSLRQFRFGYEDRGMLSQRNTYCANLLSVTESAFLDRHVDAVAEELEARGLFLDPPVYQVYRDFASYGGRLEFRSMPTAPVPLARLGAYPAETRLSMLNPTLSLNQGPLVPVTARFYADGTGTDGAAAAADSVRIRASAEDADLVELDELDDLVGRRIVIRMREGRGHVGVLLGTRGPLLRIEVERAGRREVSVVALDAIADIRLAD